VHFHSFLIATEVRHTNNLLAPH